ncbi:hypothetical protein JRQ81_014743 [Phrynocephalus forsythii]|uniref:G domain-containing protein n=1 Tax=Phrynocephalus forsythii TaxID=171643 RepID=A0A9Q1B3Z9_9SAUR|nr:hypothetical protein JRQ81_014743 [Phrynocephalus forsythii]
MSFMGGSDKVLSSPAESRLGSSAGQSRSRNTEEKETTTAMGSASSSSLPADKETNRGPRMLDEPWRKVDWTEEERKKLMEEITAYKPSLDSVKKVRVLFLGQIGAGKSSLFNSINSVFRGHVRPQAAVGVGETSETLKYRVYPVITGSNRQQLPVLFCDTMGLEEKEGSSLKTDDVVSIIKGHVPNWYQFNPMAAIKPSTPRYIESPSLKDQIHCIVFVVDGSKIEILPEKMESRLKELRHKAKEFDLPQIVLMTKVDEICPSVKDNVSNVYKSKAVLEQMQIASVKFGIPLNQIVPIKNYCSELELKTDVDILILTALRQMVRAADCYLDNFLSDESPVED